MTESFLIPKIHHAGLPDEIASKDFQYEESWKYGVDKLQEEYKKNS